MPNVTPGFQMPLNQISNYIVFPLFSLSLVSALEHPTLHSVYWYHFFFKPPETKVLIGPVELVI